MDKENIKNILLGIPTSKTASISKYLQYVTYVLLHLDRILAFNHFSSAENRFHSYQGVQREREEIVNILVSGGRKYNRSKRKNTRRNRRKRKRKRRNNNISPVVSLVKAEHYWEKEPFSCNKAKLPIISFGSAMFGKDRCKINSYQTGLTGALYRQLK
ncbi:uncharacterized protein BX663DRAFT_34778 [Cokeromyces recurvatus]|uniref:uncharacterized protein n=1 Tax=Cokeromyces recurvatus TaxID=90255 RepID=UPI0022209576|nr:uncharacterized protein BX663DRAFT_34778 [Cokeromyces recurvatus]KAI7903574.1 hypothetical protein BX663DRAFT_34778 [Cokeromyces recurvatus]